MATHLVIPDTQVKPDVPLDHLTWAGQYLVDHFAQREDVTVIHLGDHWDFPSLSQYDRGKRAMEGRRVIADIEAGNEGFRLLNKPLDDYNERRRSNAKKQWHPRKVLLRGNHEYRAEREVESNPQLDGFLTMDSLLSPGWEVYDFLTPVEIDGVSYCLTPDHEVLMADLTYKMLGDVRPGDKILAFDENGKTHQPRRYKTGTVLAADPAVADVYLVTLANGKQFKATADHRWLARKYGTSGWRWVHTYELASGNFELCRPFDVWDADTSWEAGWLSGLLDGEGTLCKPNTQQGGIQLSFAQNEGAVLARAESIMSLLGIDYTVHTKTGADCRLIRINGTSADKIRVLGRTNPARLIRKFQPEMLGRVQTNGDREDVVVSVELLGQREIVMLSTDTSTFIAEGYAHHNCHYFYNPMTGRPYGGQVATRLKNLGHSFTMGHQQTFDHAVRYVKGKPQIGLVAGAFYLHDEEYKGHQGNDHFRGIIVKHQVEDGAYDIMQVSIDYLCRRYEGVPVSEWLRKKGLGHYSLARR